MGEVGFASSAAGWLGSGWRRAAGARLSPLSRVTAGTRTRLTVPGQLRAVLLLHFISFFFFFWPCPRNAEVPGPGIATAVTQATGGTKPDT